MNYYPEDELEFMDDTCDCGTCPPNYDGYNHMMHVDMDFIDKMEKPMYYKPSKMKDLSQFGYIKEPQMKKAMPYGMDQSIYNYFGPSITEGKLPVSTASKTPYISTVQNCSLHCYKMLAMIAGKDRKMQIKLLHDCACICNSQAIYTVMGSVFAKKHALICAEICDVCAKECQKYPDQASQECAKICFDCAEACRQFARSM
jgi:Domain of Unknown Function (DUF326)